MRKPPTMVVTMRRTPEAVSGPQTRRVRALNPGGGPRRTGLKRMVALGSRVLHRIRNKPELAHDQEMGHQVVAIWNTLSVAWTGTPADRRVALTQLQVALRDWTAEDAWVADDTSIQRYRRQLHMVLDH